MKSGHWLSGVVPVIQWIIAGFEAEKETINALNEFPVPDGDTGTNMSKVLTEMLKGVSKLPPSASPNELLDELSESATRGAQGNSGGILAAMIVGAAETLKGTKKLTVKLLMEAAHNANARARASVDKPVEGTMLTVMKEMADEARRMYEAGVRSVPEAAKAILAAGIYATNETAKVMAVLVKKDQADAGAYAMSVIAKRLFEYSAADKVIDQILDWANIELDVLSLDAASLNNNLGWEPGMRLYCTEFLWYWNENCKITDKMVREFLSKIGDSVQYLRTGTFAKVHVHTDTPDEVLEFFRQSGKLDKVAVHNMQEQTEEHRRKLAEAVANLGPPKSVGIVAVARGAGMRKLMLEMGADAVVEGGQTANPAVGAIEDAINSVNAGYVIVLPSNKNIFMTAETACKRAKRDCRAIQTINMPQSLNALVAAQMCGPNAERLVIEEEMLAAATSRAIRVASVSVATNDYVSDAGLKVLDGQPIVTVGGDQVVLVASCLYQATLQAVKYLLGDEPLDNVDSVTVYTGEDFDESVGDLMDDLEQILPGSLITKNVVYGGQPVFWAEVEVRLLEV